MKFISLFLLISTLLCSDEEFFRLMGKDTSHWIHVSKQEDVLILNKFSQLYEKNKQFRFTKNAVPKIPKVIHFIWLGPCPFPPESVQNVRTWLAHHPDWKVKFWTDNERIPPCNDMEICYVDNFPFLFLRRCFKQSENWGEKSDVLRFEILYQEGGVYVDHDANCLQNFDSLHQGYDFYCGLESPHPPFAGRNITCGNGVIGSRPFHPVIGGVIHGIEQKWDLLGKKYRGRDGYSRTQLVMERTYIQLTDSLLDHLSEDGNVDIVFPAAYFFAKKGITPIYSKHFFANSWSIEETSHLDEFKNTTKKAMGKLYNRNKLIRMIGRWALSLNLMAIGSILFYLLKKRKMKVDS